MEVNKNVPNLGPRISVCNHQGKVLARLGAAHGGEGADQFIAPHGLAMDSRGDLYVGEVSNTFWGLQGDLIKNPRELRCLRKLVRMT
jgi:hypothetical protein